MFDVVDDQRRQRFQVRLQDGDLLRADALQAVDQRAGAPALAFVEIVEERVAALKRKAETAPARARSKET